MAQVDPMQRFLTWRKKMPAGSPQAFFVISTLPSVLEKQRGHFIEAATPRLPFGTRPSRNMRHRLDARGLERRCGTLHAVGLLKAPAAHKHTFLLRLVREIGGRERPA